MPEDTIEEMLEVFDTLDEIGRHIVAAVFLDTPGVDPDSEISQEHRRRGYGKPEGEA
jgi:hypothetical protein